MKHFKHTISFLFFSAFLIYGCSEENNTNNENLNDVFSLSLQMPSHGDATRVGVSESQGSKNLKTEWKDDDYVQVIVNRGNDMYDLGKCKVSNISKDKKQAFITVDRRAFPTLLTPFKVYCFTGNTHPASADAIGGGNWSAYCTYDIIRESLESFNAPMFSQVEVNGKDIPVAQFKHFGTYEVLHLKNDTDSPISVTHQGFNCEKPWYQASTTVWFNDDYDHTKLSGEWEGDVDSPEITIEPNSYGTFVSWYIPSGYKVNNAQLIATINGKAGITSTNTFSSDVTLQRGHAYHMYATWDGEELKFGPNVDPRIDEVIPADIREKVSKYMPIYDGTNPPNIEGAYFVDPVILLASSLYYDIPGLKYKSQDIKFFNQDISKNTIDMYSVQGNSWSKGSGAFISGSGDNFTVYFDAEGESHGIWNKKTYVISGTMTSAGIANFAYTFIMKEKGDDPKGKLIKTGSYRIFKDGDGLAEKCEWTHGDDFGGEKTRAAARSNELPCDSSQ